MSNRLTPTKPKRADLIARKLSDDSYTITACAPRDGAGRQTSAGDLHYSMNRKQFDRLLADWQLLRAGSPC